jgi:hypothetical protein
VAGDETRLYGSDQGWFHHWARNRYRVVPLLRVPLGEEMKRFIQVEIDINTEIEGPSYFQDNTSGDIDRYRITIRKDSTLFERNSALLAFAHECGHMIGTIFGLPGMAHDPRSFNRVMSQSLSYGDAVLNSEAEAWDNAEIMLELMTQRKTCLGNYRRLYNPDLVFNFRNFYTEVK